MNVITPLCEKHIYTINLSSDVPNDLCVSIFDFLSDSKKKSNLKSLLRFVRNSKNTIVFKMLIQVLPYSIWIKWFKNVSILKYYWSKELILKIIDSNRIAINMSIINNDPYDEHVIILNNQYEKLIL